MQEDKIQEALIEHLYRNAYGIVISNVTISLGIIYVLYGSVPTNWLVPWAIAVYALIAARVLAARHFWKHPRTPGSLRRWAWAAAGFSWISGLLWGSLTWIGFVPDQPHLFAFIVAILAGLVSGTIPSLSAFPPALIGSIFATTIPVAARFTTMPGAIGDAYLFLLACLIAINIYYGRIAYRMLHEMIRLRLENVGLIDHLQEERDRAQTADRAKTRFLAAASHDLRQPIHALGLLISTLSVLGRRGDVPSGEARSLASSAKAIVGNLSGLLNALLDISKLDAGVVTVARENVDLGELFRNLNDEFAASARAKGLSWRVVETSAHVDTDPMMLKRILDNLLTNAFRYTNSGSVLLGCRRRGTAVEIQVWDSGFGIPEEQKAAVFEEFVQLHNPARDKAQGLGLGLAIVRRTAELLGHPLKLVSVPDRGSMFSVTLPSIHVIAPALPPSNATQGQTAASLMIVDDERDVLDAMVRLLTLEGHRIYAGQSAAEVKAVHSAAARKDSAPVDLIVADYRLKDNATGVEAIKTLSAYLGRTVPGIIVTGDTSPSRIREATASGFRILHKPISGDGLKEAIAAVLAADRRERDAIGGIGEQSG
ncbi:ATP-binding protein [Mesorhizobium sp. NPDC059054]|uniref:ATP-binding protein n=1 Tax=Mesorhizobium sp. NPDC059054 TaxID=3346711 RepID=UPI0036C97516